MSDIKVKVDQMPDTGGHNSFEPNHEQIKAGEPDNMPTYSTTNPVGLTVYEAGECEHDWQPALLGPGLTPSGKEEHGFMCECGEVRTVAEFWKDEPPKTDNPAAQVWYRYFSATKQEWSKPVLVSLSDNLWVNDKMQSEFWNGPGAIIVPPPVPKQ